MSGPSKVIVLEPDPRAARQIQLGFEREGVPTASPQLPADLALLDLSSERDLGLLVVGGASDGALELLRRARQQREAGHSNVPIVFVGRGVSRGDAEGAGADEIVMRPAYLRDLVTICRLLRGVQPAQRDHLVGSLVETTGVYTLVRALATLGRSATLTLIRGLRRGEIRFYLGEVTSAQVGLIHGQAALHQLLLWTDARFDFAHEDIVRRQQIPLSSDELFADADQFLEGVREAAGELSPATVLEQDVQRVHAHGKQIPTEVHGILRMFDGHRVLADILEDSPYRVFETLRVAQKAVEIGLLRPVQNQRAKATWRAVLAIEEWLVGNDTREAVVERTSMLDSGSSGSMRRLGSRKKRKKRRGKTPAPGVPVTKPEIDWGALVPRVIGAEVGPLSGVVPALAAKGEIEIATRSAQREKLEALMDTDKRERIFPTEIGIEPSIVLGHDTDEWERVEWEAKSRALEEEKARAKAVTKQTEAVTVAETPVATVQVADAVTVQAASDTTAEVVATPVVTVTEAIAPEPSPSDGIPTGDGEPAELREDLAAARAAISAAFLKIDKTPPPGDSASPAREREVAEVRKDAVAFSDAEEAFFKRADHAPRPVKTESFDDLDEGYEPTKFWDRVFGRKPPKK